MSFTARLTEKFPRRSACSDASGLAGSFAPCIQPTRKQPRAQTTRRIIGELRDGRAADPRRIAESEGAVGNRPPAVARGEPDRSNGAPMDPRLALALLLSSSMSTPALAQEWTRFRGPNGAGMASASAIPETLDRE